MGWKYSREELGFLPKYEEEKLSFFPLYISKKRSQPNRMKNEGLNTIQYWKQSKRSVLGEWLNKW